MRARGRPILGGIAGFFFGLFLAADLVLFGAIKFKDVTVVILPVAGIVVGILLGLFPPLRRGRAVTTTPAAPNEEPTP